MAIPAGGDPGGRDLPDFTRWFRPHCSSFIWPRTQRSMRTARCRLQVQLAPPTVAVGRPRQPRPGWARIDRRGRSAAGLSGGSQPGSSGSAGRSGESAGRVWRWRPAVEPIVRHQSVKSIAVDPTYTDAIDAGVEPGEIGVRPVGPDEAGVVGPELPGENTFPNVPSSNRGNPQPAGTPAGAAEQGAAGQRAWQAQVAAGGRWWAWR
jgi:hypothetical protein